LAVDSSGLINRCEGQDLVKDVLSSVVPQQQLALAMRMGGELYALPISVIDEVLPALPIESVSQCPSFVRGVIFVRGQLIPVIDAAERLGVRNDSRPQEPHIVLLRVGSRLVGLEVDEALDLIDLPLLTAMPVEQLNVERGFLSSLVETDGQVIRILDAERIAARRELDALQTLAGTEGM